MDTSKAFGAADFFLAFLSFLFQILNMELQISMLLILSPA